MLEGLVAWVLNNYLGKYVENLNTDQLSVALLSGKVELENLPLKKDALRHLGLPVEVKSGFIGKVQLQVPVRQIRSAPWIIIIEKLYVVAAPVNLDEWDSEVEAQIAHDRKVALLDALEAQWRAEHEGSDAGYYATSYSSWLSYGTGLLANIVENLQLKLYDVHIRYEDALTCAPRAFACGLTVEALTAESCDAAWRRGFTLLADADGCSFKLLELQTMAVYWDPVRAPAGMLADCAIPELTERMAQSWAASHRYVVRPTSARARVRRERSEQPLRSRARPRLTAHLALDAVTLNLTQAQYSCAVGCARGLERIARVREHRAACARPAVPVRGHARAWWIYALSCHIPDHNWTEPRPTWESCLAAARASRQYVGVVLGMLSQPAAALPPERKQAKDDFEWRTPLHVLKPLREVAMRKVPKLTPASTPEQPGGSGRSMLVHWFPQWWGWYGAPEAPAAPAAPTAPAAPAAPSAPSAPPDLEEEILDVLADSIENNTLLKRDTVFGKFEFELNKGSLNLCAEDEDDDKADKTSSSASSESEPRGAGLELQFVLVRVSVESRPRAASHALQLQLGSVWLRERVTPDTLFPVLIAPQGMIRSGLSAMSAGAPAWGRAHAHAQPPQEPLFQLTYEKKPFGMNADYRLWVKSGALEVVYCAAAARWAAAFVSSPWAGAAADAGGYGVRLRPRATLARHWEHLVKQHHNKGERRSWHVELDISAPQILFVEALGSRDAAVLVVDFGRLRLANAHADAPDPVDVDDDEMFMTPCSTPPGSLLSPASPPAAAAHTPLMAAQIHNRLYERYNIELSDLQILVGRARDNWKYAHAKTTSSLHLLDRFSISLQAERRVVATVDPQYPCATLCGSLPALVVHLSEHKLAAVRAVLNAPLAPYIARKNSAPAEGSGEEPQEDDTENSEADQSSASAHQNATLFLLQFAIEQMSLEVQSRGRSIAEVQVSGVRCALAARPADVSLALSVHSLLLVDALQTYGPDFELLVASHKHLGMDTASGSILGSEPTSPTSPTSPASPDARAPPRDHAPPHALRRALDSLHRAVDPALTAYPDLERTSPGPQWPSSGTWTDSMFDASSWGPPNSSWGSGAAWAAPAPAWGAAGPGWAMPGIVDSEALIAVELCFVKGDGDSEDLHIANILFNNLDIIANQETIVELIGFAQRVMGPPAPKKAPSDAHLLPAQLAGDAVDGLTPSPGEPEEEVKKSVRTEITFDFHRLGVLLLRAAVHDGALVARKIATATIAEAKIQATLDASSIEVGGSLGGVQVVSLCEAGAHARVLSAGRLPPPHAPAPPPHIDKALHFTISRKVLPAEDDAGPVVEALVRVQVARVWYTHSGALLRELRSCLTEFKRYLAELARSIRAAAADMAIGLVHPRGESLYANPRLSQSMEGVSPRRRTVSLGCSLDEPPETTERIVLSVSVELESPVVVVPRAAHSAAVVVAHLGRLSLANAPGPPSRALYRARLRDISLATLDVSEKMKSPTWGTDSMEQMYDAAAGQPVLHNTALQLAVGYSEGDLSHQCEVSGSVVGGLHVTARREQYEQVLDTVRWVTSPLPPRAAPPRPPDVHSYAQVVSGAQALLEPAVPTLQLDPALRAAALAAPPAPAPAAPAGLSARPRNHGRKRHTHLTVKFEVCRLSVELRADLGGGERSLVELAFREFALDYRAAHPSETHLQVTLHSITMEDLTKEPGSKHRLLMVSHRPQVPPKAVFVSKSCPDFVSEYPDEEPLSRANCGSLPSELNVIDKVLRRNKRDSKCGATPPCSPEPARVPAERDGRERDGRERDGLDRDAPAAGERRAPEDNLVWVSVHTRDPDHPLFEEKYNKISKLTKVDFNCLNLVVSADSWAAVLDFFGVAGDDLPDEPGPEPQPPAATSPAAASPAEAGSTQTEISVRSLSVVVVREGSEWCRARVSRAWFCACAGAPGAAGAPGSGAPGAGAPGVARELRGRLGALRLTDLTPRNTLWRDRFRTHADHALTFHYQRLSAAEALSAGHEASLQVEVGPATYVHTKRFISELHCISRDFSMLRRVILQARRKVSTSTGGEGRTALRKLHIVCARPVILLPVSPRARAALAVELQQLSLDNCFRRAGAPGTVSTVQHGYTGEPEVLEVRSARLSGASLWCATRGARGPALLHAPAHLAFTIEQNISQHTKSVPDMTIQGTLTTLQCALDPAQYRLVRGVLAHNLGEALDDLDPPPAAPLRGAASDQVWTTSSLKLDLHDVTVRLEPEHGAASLACVNFIKSRLLVETYSDLSQDIDLVSQEILVSDTRYASEPANRRGNVFSHIVQPMPEHRHSVQAEVHARKRGESCAYTILVNNMRLMAILDWWEAVNQFIMQPPPPAADPDQIRIESSAPGGGAARRAAAEGRLELKLNVTDSQLVLVEDAAVWDTNAVILRSTTVIRYRPWDPAKPVSCSLNELEVFSCVLGLEEETALSIVDPAALHVTVDADHVLHVDMGALNLRLSYHDMRMFAAMLRSLPAQARAALSGKLVPSDNEEDAPANREHMRAETSSAGATGSTGSTGAWSVYAPRWLRTPPAPPPPAPAGDRVGPLRAVQVNAECITLCVIDDCLDSDVPLLEVTLAELKVEQDLRKTEESLEDPLLVSTPAGPAPPPPGRALVPSAPSAGAGRLSALLSADYYNRMLSGWEPFIEPWRFSTSWERTLSTSLSLGRVQVAVTSADTLELNVTSALVDLMRLVRANWTADYYAPQPSNASEQSPKGSPAGHRRRSPFVPYALRNHTGHRLWFTTLLTTADVLCSPAEALGAGPDDSWVCVRAGDTEPFSFGGRRARARHAPAAHAHALAPATLHQLALRLDAWTPPDPICVDRVGVYFRNITHTKTGAMARIVLEVCLEGSARKLVTVRSALRLVNALPHALEVRVDLAPSSGQWSGSGVRVAQVAPGASWAAPLLAQPGALWTRPLPRAPAPAPAPPPAAPAAIDWRAANAPKALLHYECRAPPDHVYRFCCSIVRERFPAAGGGTGAPIAGHTLTLVPALRLENLLPSELHYRCAAPPADAQPPVAGALAAGDTRPFHEVNVEEGVEISIKLDGFGWSSALSVGGAGAGGAFTARLKLRDALARRLYLNARVTHSNTEGIKVSVSAEYWLVNRSGLPLVFRAEGAGAAAGQGAEHEAARVLQPLLFSFAAHDAAPTLAMRLGEQRYSNPEWCSPFGLGPGVCVKRLAVRGAGEADEREYSLGVRVRAARGRRRHTTIVTVAPRYQLHNNTSHRLQFAQNCTATTLTDPGAMATHVSAVPGCCLPWHWPRPERERLLCVRLLAPDAAPLTAWSSGFRIDTPRTLHLACRENSGPTAAGAGAGYATVRAEVVAEGASLFVVLTDARAAPPPVRIDNYAPVSIMFHQVGCLEESVVGAHGRVTWALPEAEGAAGVVLRAPGGTRATVPLGAPACPAGPVARLAYQNFIYCAFTPAPGDNQRRSASAPPETEDILVLEVPLGSTKVVLGKKRYGERAQLWRRGPNEQLIHEGSSPPQPTDALLTDDQTISPHAMVLDIEEAAPRPGVASALVVRRADVRRASTQAWRLTAPDASGRRRMGCAHANLCVAPAAPVGLVPGNRVVLSLAGAAPLSAVSWHTLRPGSGRLDVSLRADGPTRVLVVHDTDAPECDWIEEDSEESTPARRGREWGVRVSLGGVGVSLVARSPPAELVHAVLAGVALDLAGGETVSAALSVDHMQWDNQLLGTPSPVLLYCLPERGGAGGAPALHAALEVSRARPRRYNAMFFRHFVVALRPLAVRLEERLILQLWAWAAGGEEAGADDADEAEHETRRLLAHLGALQATRYYIGLIKIIPSQIRLSMTTASKLEGRLAALKRRLGLTLIKFEDACVELEPFVRAHAFDTAAHLADQMRAHFKDELKWQAAKILGSVDFLGNPLGFVADVSEGVSGLLLEGNVGALLKNVTHGISNSAAKVTESLGDGLERVVSDEAHEETRRRIRSAAPGAHLAAGFRGLGLGILGGMTSLVKHSYEGAAAEGLPGFLAGVGKGLVGTVTKPVIGVLDLAAETASALRDTSRRSDKWVPSRMRAPRCAWGAGGRLPRYCAQAAAGAGLLHALSRGDERFLAYRIVRDHPHDIRALLSDTYLRIFTCKHHPPQIVMETQLSNLVSCSTVSIDGAHFVELGVRGGGEGVRRPRVQCDSAALAAWVARHAAYARRLHQEHAHTLLPADL